MQHGRLYIIQQGIVAAYSRYLCNAGAHGTGAAYSNGIDFPER
jgi:hypothetical protein